MASCPMTMTQSSLLGLGVALGCGLLIGIKRERRKASGPTRAYAGVRRLVIICSMNSQLTRIDAAPCLYYKTSVQNLM